MPRDVHDETSIGHCFWRTHNSSARTAAVTYVVSASDYLMDAAAGYSLLTEMYYLSQVLITRSTRAAFDTLAYK